MNRGHKDRSLLAASLRRRRLSAPAALLAEMHRPLAPLISDLVSFASPVLEPLLGRERVAGMTSEEGAEAVLTELIAEGTDDELRPR